MSLAGALVLRRYKVSHRTCRRSCKKKNEQEKAPRNLAGWPSPISVFARPSRLLSLDAGLSFEYDNTTAVCTTAVVSGKVAFFFVYTRVVASALLLERQSGNARSRATPSLASGSRAGRWRVSVVSASPSVFRGGSLCTSFEELNTVLV